MSAPDREGLVIVTTSRQRRFGNDNHLQKRGGYCDFLLAEASAVGQSPPQELEVSPRSGLYLLVKTTSRQKVC